MNYILNVFGGREAARKVMATLLTVSILLPVGSQFQLSIARAEGEEAPVTPTEEVVTPEVIDEAPSIDTSDTTTDVVDEETTNDEGEVQGDEDNNGESSIVGGPGITICHRTASNSNPYLKQTPNTSGQLNGHINNHTGPIWYQGIQGQWGDIIPPFGNFAGMNWTEQGQAIYDNDCHIPQPTHATIVATKIVCDNEEDLPDWGNIPGGPNVTATTAQDWVNSHEGCSLASGWEFAWSHNGAGNPGDNTIGVGGAGWTSFGGNTDSNGQVSTSIEVCDDGDDEDFSGGDCEDRFWFREVPQNGYIPFEGSLNTEDEKVSAEFYCNNDVINYDNWEWIGTEDHPIQAGQTYHCVAFNVPEEDEPPTPSECFIPNSLKDDDFDFVQTGNEVPLQTILNNEGYTLNVNQPNSDQEQFQIWNTDNSFTFSGKFIAKYAGNSSKFGYYINGDTNTFVTLFDNTNSPGDTFNEVVTGASTIAFALKTTGNDGEILFSTEISKNPDSPADHVVAFNPSSDDYVLAYEDLTQEQGADWDFNDMVVSIHLENCDGVPPETSKVNVYKFVDGQIASTESAGGYDFPMSGMWYGNGGKGGWTDFLLSDNNGEDPDYTWTSPDLIEPGYFTAHEVTYNGENDSHVLPSSSKGCETIWCPADINHDGEIDVLDLHIVIDNWTTDSDDKSAIEALPAKCNNLSTDAQCAEEVTKVAESITESGSTLKTVGQNLNGDIDKDGDVDVDDLLNVIANWGHCPGTFMLNGYTWGDTYEDALNGKISTDAPVFGELTNDKYVIVWNSSCEVPPPPPPPSCGLRIERISNGGFESPAIELGWDIVPSGTPGLDWLVNWVGSTTSYGDATRPEVANLEIHRGVNGWLPASGLQHVELDSDWAGPSSGLSGEPASVRISQDIPTKIGATYQISYAFSARPGTDLANNKVSVKVEGSEVDSHSADGSPLSNTDWHTFTKTFVATDTTTTVSFEDAGTPEDSLGTFLDNVSVMCVDEDSDPPPPPPTEICNNGIDDDGDQLVDSADVLDCPGGGDNSSTNNNNDDGGSTSGSRPRGGSGSGVGGSGEVLGAEDSLPGLPHTGTGAMQTTLPLVYALGLALAFLSLSYGTRMVLAKAKNK